MILGSRYSMFSSLWYVYCSSCVLNFSEKPDLRGAFPEPWAWHTSEKIAPWEPVYYISWHYHSPMSTERLYIRIMPGTICLLTCSNKESKVDSGHCTFGWVVEISGFEVDIWRDCCRVWFFVFAMMLWYARYHKFSCKHRSSIHLIASLSLFRNTLDFD